MNYYIDNYFELDKEQKYVDFDWIFYLCSNPDLFMNGIKDESSALNHWMTVGKKENRVPYNENCNNMISQEFLNFHWERYIKINDDLKNYNNDEIHAWNHWLHHGIKEERATYIINTSTK